MNLSVIIPVYNEADNIREIIKRVQATKLAIRARARRLLRA
jgi:glycosyltransferase involved in cell wall biosynthesis